MLTAVIAGALLCAAVALAQQRGQGARGGRGRFDPEQMRQRMMERMKETLGATDEEWTVIEPRLVKVQTLSRDARAGGLGAMFGRRWRRARGEAAEDQEQTPVQKAADGLRAALEEDEPDVEQVKMKLTAYRQARETVRQELAKAQEKLREVLSVEQEAHLVLMGLLD
jgi:hypothetical protein